MSSDPSLQCGCKRRVRLNKHEFRERMFQCNQGRSGHFLAGILNFTDARACHYVEKHALTKRVLHADCRYGAIPIKIMMLATDPPLSRTGSPSDPVWLESFRGFFICVRPCAGKRRRSPEFCTSVFN